MEICEIRGYKNIPIKSNLKKTRITRINTNQLVEIRVIRVHKNIPERLASKKTPQIARID